MGSSVGRLSFCGVRVRALFMVVSKLGFFICVGERVRSGDGGVAQVPRDKK